MSLLDRLREGPLRSEDYAQACGSVGSLRVLVHRLRSLGYVVESHPIERASKNRHRVEYRLRAEP